MATQAEIQAAKAVLLETINELPVAEIARCAEWTAEKILEAAERERKKHMTELFGPEHVR